jgi:predicted Ser/Thr protein kinase
MLKTTITGYSEKQVDDRVKNMVERGWTLDKRGVSKAEAVRYRIVTFWAVMHKERTT